MIKFENVGVVYPGGVKALDNINLEINEGDFVIIVGLSGAGKSTLLRSINNLVKPTDGNANFTVGTSDGFGGQAMYAVKDEVQDFADLPFYAPTDAVVKITGDEGDILSDYYVNFKITNLIIDMIF